LCDLKDPVLNALELESNEIPQNEKRLGADRRRVAKALGDVQQSIFFIDDATGVRVTRKRIIVYEMAENLKSESERIVVAADRR
jgi:hypothetical protein